MDLKKFISGSYKQQDNYKSFQPSSINHTFTWNNDSINTLFEKASIYLGELNAYSKLVPDVEFFIHMHVIKEAITSSRIEGTQTDINEVLLPEEEINPVKRDDWNEVKNYTIAMNYAIGKLDTIPLSMRLLKETHKILLSGVRGKHKIPGEIRRSQNWIGGSNLENAFFIPPAHTDLPDLLTDLEMFIHNDNINVPHLIKIAIIHYQFETIHPFLDGNGRIGRLLIPLYLIDKGVMDRPTLYMSDFFERNKISYYDALTISRGSHGLEYWVKFFLSGISETSKKSKEALEKVIKLRQDCEEKILTIGRRAKNAQILLKHLYSNPIINSKGVVEHLNITPASANNLLGEFENMGILKEITGAKRNRYFLFVEYVNIFKS